MSSHPSRPREIFVAAVNLPAEERDAYIAEACGEDDELRRRVRDLLDAHEKAAGFLESPAPGLVTFVGEPPIMEGPGTVIGPYKLLEEIGEGGMGLVFVAEQEHPVRRKVALKEFRDNDQRNLSVKSGKEPCMNRTHLFFVGMVMLATAATPLGSAIPANDNFADGEVVEGRSGRASGANRGATIEAGEPLIDGKPGGRSVWWRWMAPRTEQVAVYTFSEFTTLLAVYTGVAVDSLTVLAVGEAGNNDFQTRVEFEAVAGTLYHIAVDGYDGQSTDILLHWFSGVPSNDNFTDSEAIEGPSGRASGANIGTTREAGEPMIDGYVGGRSVWWRWVAPSTDVVTVHTFGSDFDTILGIYTGTAVNALELVAENDDEGPDLQSLVIFEAVAGRVYHVAVDGVDAEHGLDVERGNILLSWLSGKPLNDDFAAGVMLEGPSGRAGGPNFGATLEPGEPMIDGKPGGSSVWWRWTAPRTEKVTVHTFGSGFDTLLGVYTGTALDTLQLVAANDDAVVGPGVCPRPPCPGPLQPQTRPESRVDFEATAGTGYHFVVDVVDGESGIILLSWLPTPGVLPENDLFSSRVQLEGVDGVALGSNVGATIEAGEPDHAEGGGTKSVWWSWVAPGNGTAQFATLGSSFDTVVAVYGGILVEALDLVGENDDWNDIDSVSAVRFRVTGGMEYQIAIDGYDGESGLVALGWSFAPDGMTNPFRRGDALDDGRLNLTDAVLTLNFLFRSGAVPSCMKSADADDSGAINLTDAIYLLNYLFQSGPPPALPLESCGTDPTIDDLSCESHDACPV